MRSNDRIRCRISTRIRCTIMIAEKRSTSYKILEILDTKVRSVSTFLQIWPRYATNFAFPIEEACFPKQNTSRTIKIVRNSCNRSASWRESDLFSYPNGMVMAVQISRYFHEDFTFFAPRGCLRCLLMPQHHCRHHIQPSLRKK